MVLKGLKGLQGQKDDPVSYTQRGPEPWASLEMNANLTIVSNADSIHEIVISRDGRFVERPALSSSALLVIGLAVYTACASSMTFQASGMLGIKRLFWSFYHPVTWLIALLSLVCLVAIHEAIHYVFFRAAGISPKLKFLRQDGRVRGFAVYAYGIWMSRNWYLTILLSPAVTLTVSGFWMIAVLPQWRAALVYALSKHLWGCAHDIEASRKLLTLTRRAMVEDVSGGFRYHDQVVDG